MSQPINEPGLLALLRLVNHKTWAAKPVGCENPALKPDNHVRTFVYKVDRINQ